MGLFLPPLTFAGVIALLPWPHRRPSAGRSSRCGSPLPAPNRGIGLSSQSSIPKRGSSVFAHGARKPSKARTAALPRSTNWLSIEKLM